MVFDQILRKNEQIFYQFVEGFEWDRRLWGVLDERRRWRRRRTTLAVIASVIFVVTADGSDANDGHGVVAVLTFKMVPKLNDWMQRGVLFSPTVPAELSCFLAENLDTLDWRITSFLPPRL